MLDKLDWFTKHNYYRVKRIEINITCIIVHGLTLPLSYKNPEFKKWGMAILKIFHRNKMAMRREKNGYVAKFNRV